MITISFVNFRVLPIVLTVFMSLWSIPQNLFAAEGGDVNVTLTAILNDPANGKTNSDYQTVKINQNAVFYFYGEYNGKPETTAETKPGEPEWKFDSVECSPDEPEVTRSVPSPSSWTPGETISGSDSVKSSKVGKWSLTYTASVRFPILSTADDSHLKDEDGNLLYFGPYSASVTVVLKVTTIPFEVWVQSLQDDFDGHSRYKLGLLEHAFIVVDNIDPNDPPIHFSKAELKEGDAVVLGDFYTIIAQKTAGSATINVWAKDDTGTEYGPEELGVSVVAPDGVGMVREMKDSAGTLTNVLHTKGIAGAEIKGVYYLTPSDVSFCKLCHAEGSNSLDDGKVTVSGYYKDQYDALKSDIEQALKIINDPKTSDADRELLKASIIDAEKKQPGTYILPLSMFFFHKEKRDVIAPLERGISLRSKKPNTSSTWDVAGGYCNPKYSNGISSWNIHQTYWTDGSTASWANKGRVEDFANIIQTNIITANGKYTLTKGNAEGSAERNDETVKSW